MLGQCFNISCLLGMRVCGDYFFYIEYGSFFSFFSDNIKKSFFCDVKNTGYPPQPIYTECSLVDLG